MTDDKRTLVRMCAQADQVEAFWKDAPPESIELLRAEIIEFIEHCSQQEVMSIMQVFVDYARLANSKLS